MRKQLGSFLLPQPPFLKHTPSLKSLLFGVREIQCLILKSFSNVSTLSWLYSLGKFCQQPNVQELKLLKNVQMAATSALEGALNSTPVRPWLSVFDTLNLTPLPFTTLVVSCSCLISPSFCFPYPFLFFQAKFFGLARV